MKYKLTQNENSDRLILIFAGWSTDADFYAEVRMGGYDVMVVWDYSDLDFPEHLLKGYTTVCLFAWSLGVFAASVSLPWHRISMAVAVNGTPFPTDDLKGIPENIFLATLERLDERNLLKFRKRMGGKRFGGIAERFKDNNVEALKEELRNIHEEAGKPVPQGVWDRVIISSEDMVFPPRNMMKAWEGYPLGPEIMTADAPHFIDLNEVVCGAVPCRNKVGQRFRKAVPTYDSSASAQRRAAESLVEAIPSASSAGRVLEIGPGSGLLTQMLGRRFQIGSMDFIDLFETHDFGVAEHENHFSGDAEDWLEERADGNPESYDLIVSASAMQWFVNPERLFRNCRRLLKPGGMMACSTYLPGTLRELHPVNPFGLVYRSRERLTFILQQLFNEVNMREEEFRLDFGSAKEALRHLVMTGVGGSSSKGVPLHEMLKYFPKSLTYLPLYIVAR